MSCADQHNSWQNLAGSNAFNPSSSAIQLFNNDTLTVVDEKNQPVPNAIILLGYETGNPFPGNTLTTDATGAVSIPADWKAALPLTVQAQGFITSTIPVALPGATTIQISHQEAPGQIEVKGTTMDFGRLKDDGKVHFGLIFPAISRAQMLAFDLSTVISPQNDTISVIGNSVNIPSNITLPQQTVTYIFPLDFNKPDYRVYLRSPGAYHMSATHGSFPLSRVVSDIRAGKPMFELINYFTFIEGGEKDINVQDNMAGQDMSVHQTQFNAQVAVKAPAFPANNVMVSLALQEKNGLLTPTDMKRLTSGQSMNLKSSAVAPSVLSVLMVDANAVTLQAMEFAHRMFAPLDLIDGYLVNNNLMGSKPQDFSRLSFALLPAQNGVAPQFLPLIGAPSMNGSVMKLDAPALPAGLTPVATYMVLSEIESISGADKVTSEQRTRLWEVWSGAFLQQVELPKISFTRNPNRKYRWDVMFLARPSSFVSESVKPNVVDLSTITHVTRNALDI